MKRRVLVTGSSRGIGRAIAMQLAKDGFDVALHYNSDAAAAKESLELVHQFNKDSHNLQFDLLNRQQTRDVIEKDMEQHGAYYGVVCNAGIARDMPFPAIEGPDWDIVMRTNLDGFYNTLHPVIMPMIHSKQGGRIVTMSSVSGIAGNRGQVSYSAAKGGIISASKALAIELAKRKITVNCVAPGLIQTEMIKDVPLEHALEMIPLRRVGQPEEVASLVGFLFSDNAAYITRQVISINGGMV